ncbi:ABC transporter ATP-binding protein [Sphaerisporangium rubeum]|uniref:ATP-binding cassette subfamily B protein n=1 Tax=Sphaerisporangium rubeum TaxID=321317 RepID=A0A7X0III0_9ACTN|nr:ABC transporter ATP-binding protein [Sphaerisporangium rubeum]MBB6475801.1 ATP-binding cassette subfamily B protein [Sphaerisporangium rubeum]
MRDTYRAFVTTIGFGFRAAPWHAAFQIVTEVALGLVGPFMAYSSKLLVDAAIAKDLDQALVAGTVLSATIAVLLVGMYYNAHCIFTVIERTQALADRKLMNLIGGIDGLAHHERPEYLDQIYRLREERESLAEMTNASAGFVAAIVAFVTTSILLAQVHPALLSLALVAGVSMFISSKANDIRVEAQEDTSEPERLRRHLYDVGTTAGAGKELRVFGLTDEIVRRHHVAADEVLSARNEADWRAARLKGIDALVNAGAFIGAIALVLTLALNGRAGVGDVVLVVQLAVEMGMVVAGTVGYGGDFLWTLKQARRFLWLEQYARSAVKPTPDPLPVPERLRHGIDLDDVTFHYPGTDRPILANVSAHLPAGSVVALVGENGAGKTTLVKLLCDFYQPDGGQILVDGDDLARVPTRRWHQRVSTAFQDFAQFEFLARETVGVADTAKVGDDAVLNGALTRADATTVVEALPQGLDTQLGTTWSEGVDLSGGQWQKLALSRGLVREDPLLVVFDEPTAALDPQTEHALFERFAEAARSGRQNGTVTLLVSHRFSTVRMADLIIVLEDGRIREIGDHDQLMTRGDLYAELYELQSRAYR